MSIIDRRTKLKARRIIRRQKRLAESVGVQADQEISRLFFKRFDRLKPVRRFVIVWILVLFLFGVGALWQAKSLDKYYLETSPVSGGVYREGIIGAFTNSNPLFAITSVDSSVSRLLYSGLFSINPEGGIVSDLAISYNVDARGVTYTVVLRDDVKWHDGEKFDADDVVFTYKSIQNPTTKSPLRSSWSDIQISKTDNVTVVFSLKNPLSSFPYSLTNGIVPEHILSKFGVDELRSNNFNTASPIGTGAFKIKTLEVSGSTQEDRQERIALSKNNSYYGKKSGLDSIIIRSYRDEEMMLKDFDDKVIQSMIGLTSVSDRLKGKNGVVVNQSTLTSSVQLFFNNSSELLSDKLLRQALVHATNTQSLREGLSYEPVVSNSPFLRDQFAYNPEITQLPYDVVIAIKMLDDSGWVLNPDGIRVKGDKILSLKLVSQSLSEYASITQKLQQEWGAIGIDVEAILQPEEDIQSGALISHEYDVLLYGISIGYDPDVFAYWHSSQADPNSSNLNFSEFKNKVADESLEAGRTRVDETLRTVKYEPFLKQWREDAPAVALYQPRFIMVTQGTFEGFQGGMMNTATDRYWSIADWKVRNSETVKK